VLQPLELLHGLVDDAPEGFDQHEHDLGLLVVQ
jgi:hypothetical protein